MKWKISLSLAIAFMVVVITPSTTYAAQGETTVTGVVSDHGFPAAAKDTKAGTASGTMIGTTARIDIALVSFVAPEYSPAGSLIVATMGAGAIALARYRQAHRS